MLETKLQLPDGTTKTLGELYAVPSRGNPELARFHRSPRRTLCLCKPSAPLELVVRRVLGVFRLACYPGTRSAHDYRCYFYSPDSSRTTAVYSQSAVEELGEDRLYVRLDQTLDLKSIQQRQAKSYGGKDEPTAAGPSVRRNTVTLLGLLNILWERAGLNRWSPAKPGDVRRYTHCAQRLTDAVCDVRIPSGSLSERIFIPPPSLDHDAATLLRGKLRRLGEGQAILVTGEFLASRETDYGQAMALVCLRHCPLYFQGSIWNRLTRSFGFPRRTGSERCWVIAICSMTEKGNINVRDAGWFECQSDYIVCQSSHERRVADRLVAEGREFEKPMRYDASIEECPFPDFILHDVGGGPLPMEVWGLASPRYLARKSEKKRIYGGRLWEWNALAQVLVPPFPPRLPE